MKLLIFLCGIFVSACLLAQDVEHARESEAMETATVWLEMLESGDASNAYNQLTDIYKKHYSETTWKNSVDEERIELGKLISRELIRVVMYQDPENAPLPGTYAAVEYDSVYENARKHFQYIMLHSLNGEPFKVMRRESKQLLIRPQD